MESDFTITCNYIFEWHFHRKYLEKCPYFKHIIDDLQSNFCTFDVEKPVILNDVIHTLYGKPLTGDNWEYKLYAIKYSTMLLMPLPYNTIELYRLVVPDYSLLLDIALPLIGKYRVMLSLLRGNLPFDYDLSHLEQENMIRVNDKLSLIKMEKSALIVNANLDSEVIYRTGEYSDIELSKRGLLRVVGTDRNTEIINVRTQKTIKIQGTSCFLSPDGRTVVTSSNLQINVFDENLRPILYGITAKSIIKSQDSTILGILNDDISVYNTMTRKLTVLATNVNCNYIRFGDKEKSIMDSNGIAYAI